MKKSVLILTVIALMMMISKLNANTKVTLKGQVIDMVSKTPVRYAGIVIENNSGIYATVTDENGEFVLSNVSEGKHKVQVKQEAYNDNLYCINIIGSGEKSVNFEIAPIINLTKEQPLMNNQTNTNFEDIQIMTSVKTVGFMIMGYVMRKL
jgi:hypothetical protein